MLIIEINALPNGAHRNQTCDSITPPDGWAVVPAELEAQTVPLLPFVTLTVANGKITAVADNAEAREAAKKAEPVVVPEPTAEDIINAILGV